ncbi:hypothetical protein ACET3Z_005844 [Daucus carota]
MRNQNLELVVFRINARDDERFPHAVVDVADAKMIAYGAIGRDGSVCTQPQGCYEPDPAVAPYNRGCSRITRCRGGPGSPPKNPKEN